jgi:hypothetical protein
MKLPRFKVGVIHCAQLVGGALLLFWCEAVAVAHTKNRLQKICHPVEKGVIQA